VVAAKEHIALLGSANLRDKALAVNLELGVIIRDPEVVGRIVGHFRMLIRPGSGCSSRFRRRNQGMQMQMTFRLDFLRAGSF
jgi:phosphatidylserine/phosphatidylglycerophosphate/cardiolipin synthase-like enzyme